MQDVADYRTLTVLAPSGELETVRLIGIESRDPSYDAKATEFLRRILNGNVRLEMEFDKRARDDQGRLLAYVWVVHRRSARWLADRRISMQFVRKGLSEYWKTDGEDALQYRNLNAELISQGVVRIKITPPNSGHQTQLYSLYKEAEGRHRRRLAAESESGIPRNLDECYQALKLKIRQPELILFMNTPEENLSRYHSGLGDWLRSQWGLRQNSELQQYFLQLGVTHPDDMSEIILTSFHRHLNRQDIRLSDQVRSHRREPAQQTAGH